MRLHPALRRIVLRQLIAARKGHRRISFRHIQELETLSKTAPLVPLSTSRSASPP